jgi:hypothetical protein
MVYSIVNKGNTFGRLTVIGKIKSIPYGGSTRRGVRCKCECGTVKDFPVNSLVKGMTSCGCLALENSRKMTVKHGLSQHPLYRVWKFMLNRCCDKNAKDYSDYGGRGIRVCKDWRDPETGLRAFVDWANSLPKGKEWQKGMQLDRRENNKGYSPDNCQFVTSVDNHRNTRTNVLCPLPTWLTAKELKYLQPYIKQENGAPCALLRDLWELRSPKKLSYYTVYMRYKKLEWDLLEALTTLPRKHTWRS